MRVDVRDWYTSHQNIVTLCRALAEQGFTADELVAVIEKPWKWRVEFICAYCRAFDTRRNEAQIK